MDKHRQSISDKLLKPEHHDPYLRPWHQRSDTLCPQCGAAYQAGRWTWHGLVDASNAEEATCPACQRIGHALEAAYDGELQIHYNHEEYYVDIHWQRD